MKQQLNGVNIVDLVNICWEEQSKLFDEILSNQKKKSIFVIGNHTIFKQITDWQTVTVKHKLFE